jgi:hypothetical protein
MVLCCLFILRYRQSLGLHYPGFMMPPCPVSSDVQVMKCGECGEHNLDATHRALVGFCHTIHHPRRWWGLEFGLVHQVGGVAALPRAGS